MKFQPLPKESRLPYHINAEKPYFLVIFVNYMPLPDTFKHFNCNKN